MALFNGSGAAPNFIKPSHFMGRCIPAATLQLYQGANLRGSQGAAGFFTEINNRGVAVNTDFTAGVAKTILNVSGAGWCSCIIGPVAPGAGQTTTIAVTRDGVLKTLTFLPASGDRAVLGALRAESDFTTSGIYMRTLLTGLNTARTYMEGSEVNKGLLPDWDFIRMHGVPCLKFETSLLVQITHSANVTDTAADGRQSGVCYMLEQ